MSSLPYRVLYTKYNTTRKPEFRVATDICENADGRFVRKHASNELSVKHLNGIRKNCESLQDYYTEIQAISVDGDSNDITFPFIEGSTLADQIDARNLSKEDFIALVNKKLDLVLSVRKEYIQPFERTSKFEEVFGPAKLEGIPSFNPANIDSLFSNFIESKKGIYCIDYEWVFPFPVPVAYIKYRILLYLYVTQLQAQLVNVSLEEMLSWFGFSEEEQRTYWEMDNNFQQYVHGEKRKYIYLNHYRKADLSVNSLHQRIEELQKQVQDQNTQIQQISVAYQTISGSFFWRITRPARATVDFLKTHIRRNGLIHAAYRSVKILPKQGIRESVKCIKSGFRARKGIIKVKAWPTEQEKEEQKRTRFSKDILFSILVPLYNTPESFLSQMIGSVRNQTYEKWELCLADGSDEEHKKVEEICRSYSKKDSRIHYLKLEENYGISGNTNACIKMAGGNYIALFDHDDILHPSALFEVMKAICEQDADYIYTDEVTFRSPNKNNCVTVHYKPDFAPDNLLANNYICHFSVFSAELLKEVGGFRSEYDGSQDHEIILRLTYAAKKIVHIPKVLYWWRSHPQSVSQNIGAKQYAVDAAKRAVHDFLRDYRHINASIESTRAFPTIFRINYDIKRKGKVSIVIPNKDHTEDLRRCINSITEKTSYSNYEIVVVENNSQTSEITDYYSELEKKDNIRVLYYKGDFNYSRINNWAIRQCNGNYVVLLNNDTEIITSDWIQNMMMYAQRDDVGAVGAKLYFPDGRIQHAGVVIKMGDDRIAAHAYYGAGHDDIGYMGRLCYAQDLSAVTGACLMIERKKYDEVNGLDEKFAVAYNDVDFCLKLREKGYLNIFTPFAELYHHESATRGYETGEKLERLRRECELFRSKWNYVLETGDPYFNPNLSLDSPMFEPK